MERHPAIRWLTARPIAHRGLHDKGLAIDENSLEAALRAAASGFGIECDVRRSRDGEAIVFHDTSLERVADATGAVETMTLAQLGSIRLRRSGTPVPTFKQLLDAVGARVPVVCEIKSRFDGDLRLAERVAAVAFDYSGPVAFKSFDPDQIAYLRRVREPRPLGIVAQAQFDDDEWSSLVPRVRHELANFLHYDATQPDFVSYRAADLPHAVPYLCRSGLGLPILAWTVRSGATAAAVLPHCDQIVFEGYDPDRGE